jgi:hypothetical protein
LIWKRWISAQCIVARFRSYLDLFCKDRMEGFCIDTIDGARVADGAAIGGQSNSTGERRRKAD